MPSARLPTVPDVFVRDLIDGQELDMVLLVRAAELRAKRDGDRFLRLTLADRTGQLTTMVWEDVAARHEACCPGAAVRVAGRFERHPKWGPQLALRAVARAPEG